MKYTLNNIKYSPIKDKNILQVTSKFGYRTIVVKGKTYSGNHNGIDLVGGNIIIAPAKGKVTACRNTISGYSETYSNGNYVTLYHGNNIYTSYNHLKYNTVKVKVGDIVEIGTPLGEMGSTGFATGTHLHYGVKVNNAWVDPESYLLGINILPNFETKPTIIETNTYTVKKGDTLTKISKLYNITIDEILKANKSKYPKITKNYIVTGWSLIIPSSGKITYIVKKGDTLSSIATKYQTTYQKIYELNKQLIDAENTKKNITLSKMWIYPEQELIIKE